MYLILHPSKINKLIEIKKVDIYNNLPLPFTYIIKSTGNNKNVSNYRLPNKTI